MEYVVIFLFVVAAWHAIYEGIVAPTIRVRLRFYMFEIRDELRLLRLRSQEALDDKRVSAFQLMEESINNVIKLMARITLTEVLSARNHVANDPTLRASVDERIRFLDSFDELKVLQFRSAQIFAAALAVNSGGWQSTSFRCCWFGTCIVASPIL